MKFSSLPVSTILLVEHDVLLRLGLAEYLRACGYKVIEAASADEARLVLAKGPQVHVLLADAQLAGDGEGFALSAWVKRNRPQVLVVLTGGLAGKAEAAAKLCEERTSAPYPAATLKRRIEGMRAKQRRVAAAKPKRRRGATIKRTGS